MLNKRNISLKLTGFVCFLLLLPAIWMWLVNLDIAIRAVNPDWIGSLQFVPAGLYDMAEKFAVDYSTVSTLVPVLLLLFPLIMCMRINLQQKVDPNYIHMLEWDPYPPQFPFFLVMLGLTGTLYGLYIGLDVSGVAELAEVTASAETIRATIDRLLDGTATALLSSLLGLVGAFLAARPFTWLFRRLAFIPPTEDHQPLSETLSTLNRDLMELSLSSREFSERMNAGAIESIAGYMRTLCDSLSSAVERITEANNKIAQMAEGQRELLGWLQVLDKLEHLAALDNLQQLEPIGSATANIESAAGEATKLLQRISEDEQAAFDGLEKNATAQRKQIRELSEQLGMIGDGLDSMREESGGDRRAMKSALAKYLQGTDTDSSGGGA